MRRQDDHVSIGDPLSTGTGRTAPDSDHSRSVSRRSFITGAAVTASVGLAGCGGRFLNSAENVDTAMQREEDTLVWEYPASAVEATEEGEGIGYASIQFQAFDRAWNTDQVAPGLRFRLHSTVGDAATSDSGYQADSFRFRIGVARNFGATSQFRAFVQPTQWPELHTTYGYEGARRELVVTAPSVGTDGTIIVEGRFQSPRATLPRQLHCGFEANVSQPGLLGRRIAADGQTTFDVSMLDLPDGVTLT